MEGRKSRRAAGRLRRSFVRDKGGERHAPITEDNWEELLDEHGHSRGRRMLVSEVIEQLESGDDDGESAAIVMSVTGARCRVFDAGVER